MVFNVHRNRTAYYGRGEGGMEVGGESLRQEPICLYVTLSHEISLRSHLGYFKKSLIFKTAVPAVYYIGIWKWRL